MTGLASVTVSENKTLASVGAGASWLDVYLYLDGLGVAVAGGRNAAVGVGGLTLGGLSSFPLPEPHPMLTCPLVGGISYFAPREGWACDNVINFEVGSLRECLLQRCC